jgi:hypothetical protein
VQSRHLNRARSCHGQPVPTHQMVHRRERHLERQTTSDSGSGLFGVYERADSLPGLALGRAARWPRHAFAELAALPRLDADSGTPPPRR